MSEPLIALRNIEESLAYGKSQTFVLRQITLDIADDHFVSIMGPSGAGNRKRRMALRCNCGPPSRRWRSSRACTSFLTA